MAAPRLPSGERGERVERSERGKGQGHGGARQRAQAGLAREEGVVVTFGGAYTALPYVAATAAGDG